MTMLIDLDDLDMMPSEVLRGIQELIREELEFRRQQSLMDTQFREHVRYVSLASHSRQKHQQKLTQALERWNAPQDEEIF